MASNPYEVEHDIKPATTRQHRRRPDMATFDAHLDNIATDPSARAGPTPADIEAVFQLVQDQLATLATTAPSDENRAFLESLSESLEGETRISGVDQLYLDTLDRVSRKQLQSKHDDACPICAEKFLDDPHPLVVELPCHGSHRFDLECVGPWLRSKGTCPMCRKDLTKKKTIEIPKDDDEEDEDVDGLYG
ncbi:hypothetical protein F4808DRAFT_34128 [Astrocystis sublimbata]|nr:hypothetical protein F4808DRAFT_34128 [Astrocystis sublimbata]